MGQYCHVGGETVDYQQLRRGDRVAFWPELGNKEVTMTGKIRGVPDKEFPYIFDVKGDDGNMYRVNSQRMFFRLP